MRKGAICQLTCNADAFSIRVFADNGGSSVCIARNGSSLRLSPGEQFSVSTAHAGTGKGYRRIRHINATDPTNILSEFSLVSSARNNPILQHLLKAQDASAARIVDRILKASAALSIATYGHGAYNGSMSE